MARLFSALMFVGMLALSSCGDDDDGGGFCEAGTLDCICHPASGCQAGLACSPDGICVVASDGG